ncbi:hypothetical protein PPSAL_1703 [Ectopseudomonas oleovorans]|nr:hypothetical protein PPSAL_1703 [Pseudomonas oleovorans]
MLRAPRLAVNNIFPASPKFLPLEQLLRAISCGAELTLAKRSIVPLGAVPCGKSKEHCKAISFAPGRGSYTRPQHTAPL